ncbi:hypothetical protein BRE01_31160 [Brevibacillus reuszeri]|uniref:DnaB/C C-terminal domain-containing protein n=1 Tax=Brevibacillus reuszeri TaxID=54915 RepID=A0ABQ0TPH6_9BACL|nr:DnaD domain protein [Brevibacillus reuszeri]MED1858438.1 DnaD domain protein [Brevibacillus reuszeri]GED69414.1 hypothetical protein BRE01_31160 [Brevibacillus reuszeri]
MARARNIKPSFFKNEDLSELSAHARLLFVGLWCLADREGFLEDRPKRIKGELFPYENVNVDEQLQELHHMGFILRYEVDGERFISIPKFVEHQNPHHREAASKIPKPRQTVGKTGDDDQGKAQPEYSLGLSSEFPSQGNAEPTESRADSLIPDSLKLIPDTLIPPPLNTPAGQGDQREVMVVGGRNLYVFKSVIDQYKHYFTFEPNLALVELLHSYLDDGMEIDLIAWAMRDAAEKGKVWNYAKGTIQNLFAKGVKTAEQAEKADQEYQQKREIGSSGKVVKMTDKLPQAVQWQMEQEKNGTQFERGKSIADDPELAAMLANLNSKKASGK